ncbi:MAG: hypothetical protein IJL26_00075 [Clostridia bacterium]|nr:hypothetical protein [Clostridia bacterium]
MKALYKIGVAVCALAIFPVTVFAPFFKLIITTDIASFLSKESQIIVDDSYSLRQLYDLYLQNRETLSTSGFSLSALPENVVSALRIPAIVFLALFALTIICAVLLLFIGLFSKQRRGPVIVSVIGAASALGMNIAFDNFAKPLIKGTVTVKDIFGEEMISKISGGMSTLGEAIQSIFGNSNQLIDIRLFSLSAAYVFIILLFVAVLLITVFYTFAIWDKQN